MWKISACNGSAMICLVASLFILISNVNNSDGYGNYYYQQQQHNRWVVLAFCVGTLINIQCCVLLYGLNFHPRQRPQQQEVINAANGPDTTDTYQGAFVHVDDDRNSSNNANLDTRRSNTYDKWFPCCCGIACGFPFFFVWALSVVYGLLATSLRPPYSVEVYHTGNWSNPSWLEVSRHVFFGSAGVLFAASLISWIQRGYPQLFLQAVRHLCCCGSDGGQQVGQEQQDPIHTAGNHKVRMAAMIVSVAAALVCGTVSAVAFHCRKEVLAGGIATLLGPRNEKNGGSIDPTTLYVGQAHVTGYEIVNPVTDDSWCGGPDDYDTWSKSIPVNVTVAWGGSWGCPTVASDDDATTYKYCETVVSTSVSCRFDFDRNSVNDDDDLNTEDDDVIRTEEDYVRFRYQTWRSNENGDDAAKDTYDPDSAPAVQGASWNGPHEAIFGQCSTCEARSQEWVTQELHDVLFQTQVADGLLGMAAMFLVWPILFYYSHARHHGNGVSRLQSSNVDSSKLVIAAQDTAATREMS